MADWVLEKDGVIGKIEGAVATIRVNKPELKNGMDWKAFGVMADVFTHIADDPDARVLVVTGTGDYFYTGGRVDANDPEDRKVYGEYQEKYYAAKRRVKLPMIAAINGHCLKGGMSWLMDADMAIAKKGVTFGYPEVRMGGVPMLVMADSMELPKKIALQAYYSSEPFDAETAFRLGLLNAIVEEEDFWPTVDRFVHMVIDNPSALIQMTHDMYYEMAKIFDPIQRNAFAQKMLAEKVLPHMAKEKQEYNI